MASLSSNDKYWIIRFKDKNRSSKTKAIYFPITLSKVEIELRKYHLEQKYLEGSYDPWSDRSGANTTFKDYLTSYINEKTQKKWSPNTASDYKFMFESILSSVGNHALSIETVQKLEKWLNESNLSYSSKVSYSGRINAFINWCKAKGVLTSAGRVAVWQRKHEKRSFFTEEQMITLRDSFPKEDWLHTLVPFLFYSGLRIGEALSLNVDDIDENYIHVGLSFITKTGVARAIPYREIPNLGALVDTQLRKPRNSTLLFDRVDVRRASRRIKHNIRTHLKKENLHTHCLRHGCATWLLKNGVSIYDVKTILGHARLSTTEVYLKYGPADLGKSLEKVFGSK